MSAVIDDLRVIRDREALRRPRLATTRTLYKRSLTRTSVVGGIASSIAITSLIVGLTWAVHVSTGQPWHPTLWTLCEQAVEGLIIGCGLVVFTLAILDRSLTPRVWDLQAFANDLCQLTPQQFLEVMALKADSDADAAGYGRGGD